MTRLGALLVALAGCGADTVVVELNFPSVETFVRSESARILAVDLEDGEEGACPELLEQARIGVLDELAAMDSGRRNVCEFREGGVVLSDVSEGLKAYVAVVEGPAGEVWLTGCAVADVYVDPPPLTLVLFPTPEYRRAFPAGHPPAMCTADAKCALGCVE